MARSRRATGVADREHLAAVVPVVRQRFALDDAISDDVVLSSLIEIASHGDRKLRWKAAFDSTLGHWLALRGTDLNTALSQLIALLPGARN